MLKLQSLGAQQGLWEDYLLGYSWQSGSLKRLANSLPKSCGVPYALEKEAILLYPLQTGYGLRYF
jgi:hypothetical protein